MCAMASTALSSRAMPSLFATYPRAPEDLATFTMLALSCMDNSRIPTPGKRLFISRAALKPSSTGMVTSRMTRSGRSCRALASASCPLAASPQTSNPWDSRTVRTPARSASWSSTIRIFNIHFHSCSRGGGCTLRGSRLYGQSQSRNPVNTLQRILCEPSVDCRNMQ